MSVLWSSKDFAAAVKPLSQPGVIGDVGGISIDSRAIDKGDAFFAIKGERFDGHSFARAALDAGAAVVVLEQAQNDQFTDLSERVVFVDDVLSALERLGMAARARSKGKILAVTGSVGKTSTKEALRVALQPSGKVHAAIASFNNHWGVPLTLARMPADCDFGIFEIGMSHAGEISNLVAMVQPHLAIITTIAASHIGNFNSIDEIAAAKAEIFEGVVPGGVALINGDNPFADYLFKMAEQQRIETIYRFGQGAGNDIHLRGLTLETGGSQMDVEVFNQGFSMHLGAAGEHLAMNALSVIGAVVLCGADLGAAVKALGSLGAAKGRGERHILPIDRGSFEVIDESYNANPSSVAAALATLGLLPSDGQHRKIAVLGDMLELGEDSAQMHRELLKSLDEAGIDRVYLCGPMMSHLWEVLPEGMRGHYAATSAELIEPLKSDLKAGDAVMIKGSFGSRMGPIVAALVETYEKRHET